MIRIFLIIAGLFICWQAEACEVLRGPVAAQVVKVRDGDTIVVDALTWPGQRVRVAVRIAGIDTAEMRTSCPAERSLAEAAKDAVQALVRDGAVTLHDVRGGKYFGRVLARVVTTDGRDVGATLLRERLAWAYKGRGSRKLARFEAGLDC